VTNHGRKYGEKDSHPIPLWNGVFEHYDRIGEALWEFAWCVDKITEERDGVGLVLGGAPVKTGTIASGLKGSNRETIRRHMDTLEAERFIRRRRTPYGHVIEVLNSRKFGIWKREKPQNDVSQPHEKQQNEVSLALEKHIHVSEKPQKVVYKEDSAEDSAVRDAAEEPAPAAFDTLNPWKVVGSDLPLGSPRFQKIFEHYFATRNGNPLSDAMERAIQLANKQGVKVPKPFYDAKRTVERREAEELACLADTERPELEELPWVKR
jgi:hypothetical protein